jgi:ubiquinone/menaquinone biosynthesis C-methylase UbiE
LRGAGVTLVRVGPVHFQPLEQELEPVTKYLTGAMLNAGCGSRDVSAFLRQSGTGSITRYDLGSTDPEVVLGPLEEMPFADATFDSVLCNAVLEHVHDAERAMQELARVVRHGGHVVVAVPFLQPYHACPGDYRRYTADGLVQLGRGAGLELVEILPVHSFAQTFGWLLWEYASEKGGRVRKTIAWAIAYLATRLSHRTDRTLARNANTFQAVFRRPVSNEADVIGTHWRHDAVPRPCRDVPTMLVPDELRLLHHLGENYYSGAGVIVDAGSFLGGSTVALAAGLARNPRRHRVGGTKPIHAFDRFEVEDWTRGQFFPESTAAGASFREQFERNIAPYADVVDVHAGDVRSHPWNGGPIEILFIDIAKNVDVCDWITTEFFPHLIPGRSLIVQQDYLYHHWVGWLHVTMEHFADYFEYVCDTEVNSAVFLNTKEIPRAMLGPHVVAELPLEEKVALMDRAASRFDGARREMILAAKTHFIEMLQAS